MSDSKAGSMAGSTMWAFAIGSAIVGAVLGGFVPGFLGFLLGAAIFIAGGWAAVYMTQASTGKGIVGMLVAGLAAGVIGFIFLKMAASSAMSGAGGQAFNDAMQKAQAQNPQLSAEQQAALTKAGSVAVGAVAGVAGFFGALIKTFLFGMVGCFIGGAMKKSATGGSAGAVNKAA